MQRYRLIGAVLAVAVLSSGCSLGNREDRLRSWRSKDGEVGINITTATRRLAIVHPSGRTCSELGPPAVIQGKKELDVNFDAAQTPVGKAKVGVGASQDLVAVQLQATTERIECLRIALFHVCNAAVAVELTTKEEAEFLETAITTCGAWNPPRGIPEKKVTVTYAPAPH